MDDCSPAVYLIFRFLTGFCSSAFLSVAGGTVSDLFNDAEVAGPMAVYTVSPFIGPALGPFLSGYVASLPNVVSVIIRLTFCMTDLSTK